MFNASNRSNTLISPDLVLVLRGGLISGICCGRPKTTLTAANQESTIFDGGVGRLCVPRIVHREHALANRWAMQDGKLLVDLLGNDTEVDPVASQEES